MTLHSEARSVLESWPAPNDTQEKLRREYLAHLDRYPEAMSRACRPGHLTASAAVVDPSGRYAVLTLHRAIGMWLQLGGHCEEEDATLAAAALREVEEESGITGLRLLPDPVRLDRHAVPCGEGSWHLDVQYVAVAPPGATLMRDPDESDGLEWFPVDRLPHPSDEACRELVLAAAERVRSLG